MLTQVDDCLTSEEQAEFLLGFENIQLALSPTKEIKMLTPEDQLAFLTLHFEGEAVIARFLETLKNYSLLHFESSEKYMKNYLSYEFMPGRYLGNVLV